MRKGSLGLLALLALPLVQPAKADAPVMFEGIAGQLAMQNMLWEPMRRNLRERGDQPPQVNPSPGKSTLRPTDTAYATDPAVSARVERQFAEFVARQAGRSDVPVVQAELHRADLPGVWNQIWSGDGLRQGDLLDVQVSYWLTNWIIANGQGDTTRQQTQAVREQLRAIVTASPALATLSTAQRQELAEVMVLNGAVQVQAYAAARRSGDRVLLARLADAATTRFRNEAQVDLRQFQLTEAGFSLQR
jgi:hypothetical protein